MRKASCNRRMLRRSPLCRIYYQKLVRLFSEEKDPVIVEMVAVGDVATYPANHAIPHQDQIWRIVPGLTDRFRFKDYATWHPQFACLVCLDMDRAVVYAVASRNPGEIIVAYSDSGDTSVVDRESVNSSCNATKYRHYCSANGRSTVAAKMRTHRTGWATWIDVCL
jgi:hypothetical protein